jgi:phthiocerol/phenolphthiocerol synthesis type-I polyketide synthase E
MQTIELHAPTIPYVSNVTGDWIRPEDATDATYWAKQLRDTVQFSQGIKKLLEKGKLICIEIGPGSEISALVNRMLEEKGSEERAINVICPANSKTTGDHYFFSRLGRLWSQGVQVDWNSYAKHEKRRRISLPTYSFEPNKFPAEVNPFEGVMMPGAGIAEPVNKELKDWIYYPLWKGAARLLPVPEHSDRTFLFFSTGNKAFAAVKKQLSLNGGQLVEVLSGEEFIKHSKKKYTISAKQTQHYQQLLAALKHDGIAVTDIMYAWGMGVDAAKLELHEENTEIHHAYFALVKLIQALRQNDAISKKRMAVITGALYKVSGNEKTAYGQSLLLGLVNALPQEYSVSCCNIDINLHEKDSNLVGMLAEELWHNEGIENRIVALRHGQRWIREYQKNTTLPGSEKTILRQGGTYLITGGLGNVGFILAKYLLQQYNARLILTGRKELSSTYAINSNAEEWLQRLSHLKSLGGHVQYVSADVADLQHFKKAIAETEATAGANIQGVIHAAGTVDFNEFELIEDITYKKAFKMFSSKVKGLENLYTIFKDHALDFAWVTSSLSTVLGGVSFSTYAAANLYMDHFIAARQAELPGWKSVGLGEMLFTEDRIQTESKQARSALMPDEIAALFQWSLSAKGSPVLIETALELSARLHKVYGQKKDAYLDSDASAAPAEKAARPDLMSAYVAPVTEAEKKLVTITENFFGIEGLGTADNFFELGGDSLKAMVLLKRIKKEFNISLSLKEFFNFQTLGDVAGELDNIAWLKSDVTAKNEITI